MASHLKTAIVNRELEELERSRCQSRGHVLVDSFVPPGHLRFATDDALMMVRSTYSSARPLITLISSLI